MCNPIFLNMLLLTCSFVFSSYVTAFAQPVLLTGKVTDFNKGEPLPGVNVLVEGTSFGTVTDMDGNYKISVPSKDAVLVFSFIGYLKETVVPGEQTLINIGLVPDIQSLDEIVVVGYSAVKKENLTGAVTTVSSKELESRPVSSLSDALTGVVPNLKISSVQGGMPGEQAQFQLRGIGTLNSNGQPLIIIDGVEGDPSTINPNDIESVSILKDAAASSIYGSKAPYGVILITTKSGMLGEPTVKFSANSAWKSSRAPYNAMGSLETMEYWRQADMNANDILDKYTDEWYNALKARYEDPSLPNMLVHEQDPTSFGRGLAIDSDPYSIFFKDYSLTQDYNLSVSGGTDKGQYYFSGGVLNDGGLLSIYDDYYDRYSFLGKYTADVTKWFQVSYRMQYAKEEYVQLYRGAYIFFPMVWDVIDPLRDPNGNIWNSEVSQYAQGARKNLFANDKFNNSIYLNLNPVKGLNIKATGTYNLASNEQTDMENKITIYDINGAARQNEFGNNNLIRGIGQQKYYNLDLYADYSAKLGLHNMNIIAGFQQEVNDITNFTLQKTDRAIKDIYTIATATGLGTYNDMDIKYSRMGYFGRFSYNYSEKYLLELNARYDATSHFPAEQRWGFFPSASVGYIVSKESFFQPLTQWVSFLKFRGSYGILGNSNLAGIRPYYQNSMTRGTSSWVSLTEKKYYETTNAPGISSDFLTWEKPSMLNFGVDLNLFNNRLQFVYEWYERVTRDHLGPRPPIAKVIGLSPGQKPFVNNAELTSKGIEFSALYKDRVGDFNYAIGAGISTNEVIVTKYLNEEGNLPDIWGYNAYSENYYEGMKLGEIWGYTTVGFINDLATLEKVNSGVHDQSSIYAGTWNLGDIMYADLDDDGDITSGTRTLKDHGDLSIIGNETPDFEFNFSTSVNWKGIDLKTFWIGAIGGEWYVRKRAHQDVWFNEWLREQFFATANGAYLDVHEDNYWTPENTNAYFPKPYIDPGNKKSVFRNTEPQTKYLQNTNFLRLKNLQIGYTIPQKTTNILKLKDVRIYLSGENLLTFTKLIIHDPEMPGPIYPYPKTYSAGLSATF